MSNKNEFEFRFEEKPNRFEDIPSGTAFVKDCEQPAALYVKRPNGTLAKLVRNGRHDITVDIMYASGFDDRYGARPVDLKGFFGEYI